MTVRELIDALNKLSPDLDCYHPDPEEGPTLVEHVRLGKRYVMACPETRTRGFDVWFDDPPAIDESRGEHVHSVKDVVIIGYLQEGKS